MNEKRIWLIYIFVLVLSVLYICFRVKEYSYIRPIEVNRTFYPLWIILVVESVFLYQKLDCCKQNTVRKFAVLGVVVSVMNFAGSLGR